MWLLYAAGSAFFAGVTSILAKCGIKKTDSTVATAVRTIVVLIFAWGMVFLAGSQDQIPGISSKTSSFPDHVRACYWSILAMLFQGTSDRRC